MDREIRSQLNISPTEGVTSQGTEIKAIKTPHPSGFEVWRVSTRGTTSDTERVVFVANGKQYYAIFETALTKINDKDLPIINTVLNSFRPQSR